MLRLEPTRPRLLKLNEDPSVKKSNIESEDPDRMAPYSESVEPRRPRLLSEKQLPSEDASSTERLLPICVIP
jgi:hypothetical protein